MVRNLPQIYRQDPWILALAGAIAGVLDSDTAEAEAIRAQLSLDTITWALDIEERCAGITPPAGASLDMRRSALKAKLRGTGKATLQQIQAVADSWKNGQVSVSFTDGTIHLTFNGEYGVPEDLSGLKAAVLEVIPAHLSVSYDFRYLLIREIHQVKTLAQMEALTLNMFAGG